MVFWFHRVTGLCCGLSGKRAVRNRSSCMNCGMASACRANSASS